jgi:hypothetical protein
MNTHKLTKENFEKLLYTMGLTSSMMEKSLGFETFPLEIESNRDSLYHFYLEREGWIDSYIDFLQALGGARVNRIIFGEASRMGNRKYIYRQVGGTFYYASGNPGYFKNVQEAVWGESIVIDFFSPFGVNHTSTKNGSRDILNRQYLLNQAVYEEFFNKYLNSILGRLGLKLCDAELIIVAPQRTRDSILNFLGKKCQGINVKCYQIDERGAKNEFINKEL